MQETLHIINLTADKKGILTTDYVSHYNILGKGFEINGN